MVIASVLLYLSLDFVTC